MPHYFFHTADGSRDRDKTGTELQDHATARQHAIVYAGDVISDEPEMLWNGRDFRVEVTDEQDQVLFTIIILAVEAPAAETI